MAADSELDILIRLLANTQGAEAVQAALNKTKDATGATSKAPAKRPDWVSFNVWFSTDLQKWSLLGTTTNLYWPIDMTNACGFYRVSSFASY